MNISNRREADNTMSEESNTQHIEWKIKHIPVKRTFDILFGLAALIVGLPIFALISLLIYYNSPGEKIIYSHRRIGRGGKIFRCFKFRTMYPDSDHRLKELLSSNPAMKEEWEKSFKLKSDPRITPIGKFLRKTSLDELPQFWNVIKGDLSIVGPRPVVQEEIDKHIGHKAAKILSIRPGLTGVWQVSGRNNICYKERIELDEYYVDNQSLLLDLKLIGKTIPVMLFSKGAY